MTDTATAILVGPLAAFAIATVGAAAVAAVRPLLAAGLVELQKLTGIRIQQAAEDKLDAFIEDKVGAEVATAADNLATASIPAGSPIIATIANAIIAEAPDLLAKAGITPDAVAGMVHGEIGKWQASMTSVAPAAATAPAATAQ